MPQVNRVTLIGYLAKDPELRYTPQGSAVCEFRMALNRRYKKKDTEEVVEEVSLVDVTAWNRTAEICAEYLGKGRCVYVSGSLRQDRWQEAESGEKRSKLKVVAQEVQFIGKPDADEEFATVSEEEPAPEEAAPAKGTPAGNPKSKR